MLWRAMACYTRARHEGVATAHMRIADINILATHWHGVSGRELERNFHPALLGKTFDYIALPRLVGVLWSLSSYQPGNV